VHRDRPIPDPFKGRVAELVDLGALERVDRGRVILSRRFYELVKKPGEYTRKKGLDRNTNMALLRQHIVESGEGGCPLQELLQVLPARSREQVKKLLRELRDAGEVHMRGVTRMARWHGGPGQARREGES